jgi:hypothetical protein
MASVDPGCGIEWSLLAGIGRIESNHGQYGGATLAPNGDSAPRIVGEVLDGTKWDFIPDTDDGRLDSDTRFDHAVGPMQFIPSTWAAYGADANGDGVADPFNINDAALGSARYLCAAGGNLSTTDGQIRAVMAYNHSDEYLALVLAMAASYASGVPVDGPIVGITSGDLPPIDTTFIPPVNPGRPAAVSSPESTANHGRATASAKSSRKPAAAKPAANKAGGSATPGRTGSPKPGQGPPANGGSSTGASNTTAPAAPTPAPGVPNAPVPLPLPPPAPAPAPVVGVSKTVCTATGVLGLPVQIPCPSPTPDP